jgi:hypothetical protein
VHFRRVPYVIRCKPSPPPQQTITADFLALVGPCLSSSFSCSFLPRPNCVFRIVVSVPQAEGEHLRQQICDLCDDPVVYKFFGKEKKKPLWFYIKSGKQSEQLLRCDLNSGKIEVCPPLLKLDSS